MTQTWFLPRLISDLSRRAVPSYSLSSRISCPIQNPGLFDAIPEVEEGIKYAARAPFCGVFVFPSPPNSDLGTQHLNKVAADLQGEGSDVVVMKPDGSQDVWWFRQALCIDKTGKTLSELLKRKLVIIIDKFDTWNANPLLQQGLVVNLATQSYAWKKFVVLIAVSDPALLSKIIKWNGGQKIKLIGGGKMNRWWVRKGSESQQNIGQKQQHRRHGKRRRSRC